MDRTLADAPAIGQTQPGRTRPPTTSSQLALDSAPNRERSVPGHPDLAAAACQPVEQRLAPGGVEMRRDLVQEQYRPPPRPLRDQIGMG
jgi:hypothetical protein